MGIDFNKSEDFVNEFKIFNDGNAGVVENVKVIVDKKAASDTSNHPNYKIIASDGKSEVNEGFYYQEPDSNAFNKYQAQRLIMLARGVLGDNVVFPPFNTPTEALDIVMTMIAPELLKQPWRVAVCYGTTKRKSPYLGFKSFGSFIQKMSEPNTLSLGAGDSLVRGALPEAASTSELVSGVTGNPPNTDWLEDK